MIILLCTTESVHQINTFFVTASVNKLTMATRTNPYDNEELTLTEKDAFVSVKTGKESQARDSQIRVLPVNMPMIFF